MSYREIFVFVCLLIAAGIGFAGGLAIRKPGHLSVEQQQLVDSCSDAHEKIYEATHCRVELKRCEMSKDWVHPSALMNARSR